MCNQVTVYIIAATRRQMSSCPIPRIIPSFCKKGTAVARMVAANEVPEMVVADGIVGAL